MNRPRALSRIELLQGTLDLIILQTLRWGPRHGYGIAQMIRASSDEVLHVDTGSLYPALRSEEHTSELQSQSNLVCRLLLEKKKTIEEVHQRGEHHTWTQRA